MTKRSPLDNPALAEHAAEIRRLGKRAVEDVIEIGRLLTECKRICGHGNWLPWLDREFGWTEMTATRFINVYEMSKSNKLLDLELPISGLYLLAAPSTPKEARDQIIERAQAGETVPVAEVKRTIKRTKGHKQPASKPRERKSAEEKTAYEAGRLLGTLEIASEAAQREFIRNLPAEMLANRDDIGPTSTFEIERRDARIEELEYAKRQLEIRITGLEREVEELRGKLATGTGGDMSTSEFQTAIRKWEETVETQRGIIARLENENAKLRAGLAAPPADDGLDIPGFLDRTKQGAAS